MLCGCTGPMACLPICEGVLDTHLRRVERSEALQQHDCLAHEELIICTEHKRCCMLVR